MNVILKKHMNLFSRHESLRPCKEEGAGDSNSRPRPKGRSDAYRGTTPRTRDWVGETRAKAIEKDEERLEKNIEEIVSDPYIPPQINLERHAPESWKTPTQLIQEIWAIGVKLGAFPSIDIELNIGPVEYAKIKRAILVQVAYDVKWGLSAHLLEVNRKFNIFSRRKKKLSETAIEHVRKTNGILHLSPYLQWKIATKIFDNYNDPVSMSSETIEKLRDFRKTDGHALSIEKRKSLALISALRISGADTFTAQNRFERSITDRVVARDHKDDHEKQGVVSERGVDGIADVIIKAAQALQVPGITATRSESLGDKLKPFVKEFLELEMFKDMTGKELHGEGMQTFVAIAFILDYVSHVNTVSDSTKPIISEAVTAAWIQQVIAEMATNIGTEEGEIEQLTQNASTEEIDDVGDWPEENEEEAA